MRKVCYNHILLDAADIVTCGGVGQIIGQRIPDYLPLGSPADIACMEILHIRRLYKAAAKTGLPLSGEREIKVVHRTVISVCQCLETIIHKLPCKARHDFPARRTRVIDGLDIVCLLYTCIRIRITPEIAP